MAVEVIIPSLGLVVEEVTIVRWLKSEGDHVDKGEPLLEVESEKVTTEIESPASGILGSILRPDGATVPITHVVAVIVAEGEAVPEKYQKPLPQVETQAARPSPAKSAFGPERKPTHVRAAPLAKKIAEAKGVDLSRVTPTGPHGTIMKKDVEAYLASMQEQEREAARGVDKLEKVARPAAEAPPGRIVPLDSMRKTVAARMSRSAFSAPHMYLFSEMRMDPLMELYEKIKAGFEQQFQARISINDFLIKAVALSLREFPYLNARWEDKGILLLDDIHIGLAVALDEGLIVPAIPTTDRLGIGEIARHRVDLVERARQGKLQRSEIDRGTFTITSLAKFDIIQFTAIINFPQSAILSVGTTQEKLVLKEDKVCAQKVSVAGLSVDHRVADGAYGAAFLSSLKKKIENPLLAFLNM